MTSHYDGELLPLLGAPRDSQAHRLHFLDNLRTTLTVILIFYHASTLVVWENLFILIFTFVNNASIAFWGLFFFVSGYSAALALTVKSEREFIVSRTIKIGAPAGIYAWIIQPRLVRYLSLRWRDIFGSIRTPGTYERISGPVAYVTILLVFDYHHVIGRLLARKWRAYDRTLTLLWPRSRIQFLLGSSISMVALAFFVFLQLLGFQLVPQLIYDLPSYDILGSDAPLSFFIAYSIGVNFPLVREYIDMSLRRAYVFLSIALFLPCFSIGIYFTAGNELDDYVFGAAFFAWLRTTIFFAIPIPIISIFTQATWATREWGFLTRHTYVQMFVNMIPVQLGIYFAQGILLNSFFQTLLAGAFAVAVSWAMMLLWATFCRWIIYYGQKIGHYPLTY